MIFFSQISSVFYSVALLCSAKKLKSGKKISIFRFNQKVQNAFNVSNHINHLLIVSVSSYFGNVFCQTNYLMAVAVFVVIPNIQYNVFSVCRNDGCVAVIN